MLDRDNNPFPISFSCCLLVLREPLYLNLLLSRFVTSIQWLDRMSQISNSDFFKIGLVTFCFKQKAIKGQKRLCKREMWEWMLSNAKISKHFQLWWFSVCMYWRLNVCSIGLEKRTNLHLYPPWLGGAIWYWRGWRKWGDCYIYVGLQEPILFSFATDRRQRGQWSVA